MKLSESPTCELYCAAQNRISAATEVHHVIAIKDAGGWERRLDMANLKSTCHSCHMRVEAEGRRKEK